MAKYTTTIQNICEALCGFQEEGGFNSIEDTIKQARGQVFSFKYPIWEESYREKLESAILRHFWTREIGMETFGAWKLKLWDKMNLIMPRYNELYRTETLIVNPLYNSNLHRSNVSKGNEAGTNEDATTTKTTATGTSEGTNNQTTNSKDRESDTPQNGLTGLENDNYMSYAKLTDSTSSGTTTGSNTSSTDGTSTTEGSFDRNTNNTFDEWVVGMTGTTESDLIMKYRETLLNIDSMIMSDLDVLFMQVW